MMERPTSGHSFHGSTETTMLRVTRHSADCGKGISSITLALGCPRVVRFTTIFEMFVRRRRLLRSFHPSIRGIFFTSLSCGYWGLPMAAGLRLIRFDSLHIEHFRDVGVKELH